jgi:hypothetical protein
VVIICMAMVFLITACNNKKDDVIDNPKDDPKIVEQDYGKAVFERNNNIYFYDEKLGNLYPIGDTTKFKELMVLSPDEKNIAFKYFYEDGVNPTEIVIYNLESKEYNKISIDDEELKNIIELKWINNERLLVSSAINPSVLKYGIYDVNSKEQIHNIKGLLMDIFEDGNLLLYSKTTRKNEEDNSSLFLGEKLIYQIDNSLEEISFATISEDKKNIAFTTFSYSLNKGEVGEVLYTGKFHKDQLVVTDINKVNVPSNIIGTPFFDKNNNLYIKGEEDNYKVEGSFFSLVEMPQEEDVKPTQEQLVKFKQVLKRIFVDEFIEDYLQLDELEIYNIQWF